MTKYIYRIVFSALTLSIFSCTDDFENVPVEQYTKDFVFSKTDSLGQKSYNYLNTIYSTMRNGHNGVGDDYLDSASDDAVSSVLTSVSVDRLANGTYSSLNIVGADMRWSAYYNGIRMANMFIQNIDRVPLKTTFNDGQPMTRAWKAEAKFIRAYHYFELLKRYGGIPIVRDEPYNLGDDVSLPRRSFSDCVNYIVSEMDAIKDSLRTSPVENQQASAHVVTKGAALALKARVLLYAASPLYNGGNIDGTNPLVGYTEYDPNRWKLAADAAKDFINQMSYYELIDDFRNVFITEGNREVIFFRQGGQNKSIEQRNAPIGYGPPNKSDGRTSPTQNLVESFPMLDGKKINDPTSIYTYDVNNQYASRDPRLGYTVFYNGSMWLNRNVETYLGGNDNPNSSIQKTETGYYMSKFMGKFSTTAQYVDTSHDWVIFRYAEILLNFAEAQNEFIGPNPEVYQVLYDLRARAGIEPGTGSYGLKSNMTKNEMRDAIRNERRIELAFEEHRYWDIRRWKIADVAYNHINGLLIQNRFGEFSYNNVEIFSSSFEDRRYFYPIPYGEVVENPKMIQNPGWN